MTKNILITWDIDGTLICGSGAIKYHREAFAYACQQLFGQGKDPEELLGHSVDGMMDRSILSEMMTKLGHEPNEQNLRQRRNGKLLC